MSKKLCKTNKKEKNQNQGKVKSHAKAVDCSPGRKRV